LRRVSADWVGEWNLGGVDKFEVCDYQGMTGQAEPLRPQYTGDWFGHDPAPDPGLSPCSAIYYRWIHNYRYGRNW
jgi:hypothetical protein